MYLSNIYSTYRELSVREAECMQQQGETTSTVEKIRSMQEEIQSLKWVFKNEFCFLTFINLLFS